MFTAWTLERPGIMTVLHICHSMYFNQNWFFIGCQAIMSLPRHAVSRSPTYLFLLDSHKSYKWFSIRHFLKFLIDRWLFSLKKKIFDKFGSSTFFPVFIFPIILWRCRAGNRPVSSTSNFSSQINRCYRFFSHRPECLQMKLIIRLETHIKTSRQLFKFFILSCNTFAHPFSCTHK